MAPISQIQIAAINKRDLFVCCHSVVLISGEKKTPETPLMIVVESLCCVFTVPTRAVLLIAHLEATFIIFLINICNDC